MNRLSKQKIALLVVVQGVALCLACSKQSGSSAADARSGIDASPNHADAAATDANTHHDDASQTHADANVGHVDGNTTHVDAHMAHVDASGGLDAMHHAPALIGSVDVGGNLEALAVSPDGSTLFVSSYIAEDNNTVIRNTITSIDTASQTVLNSAQIGMEVEGMASDGTELWAADAYGAALYKIDGTTLTVTSTLQFPDTGVTGGFAPPYKVVFDGTHIWTTVTALDEIVKIDPSSDAILGTVPVTNPYELLFDGTSIWTTHFSTAAVTKIDPLHDTAADVSVCEHASVGLAIDRSDLYVTCGDLDGEELVTVDSTSNAVLADVRPNFVYPGLMVAGDGYLMGISNDGNDSFWSYDLTALTFPEGMVVGTGPEVDIAFDGNDAWVASASDGTVYEISP